MISIEQLTKAQQQPSPQDERGASLLVPESTAEGRLEQHIAKIISLPSKNIFGQPYVPLQEVLVWRTKALAIVKELKNA